MGGSINNPSIRTLTAEQGAKVNDAGANRVLVVDDDHSVRRVLTELFRRDGLEVRGAQTGAEALASLADFTPDVVVLDLGLPDVNGFDLLRSIRDRHEVPVVVLSGRADESDRVLALELGADDYVVKPFLNRELVARVRVRLRRPPAPATPREGLGDTGLHVDPVSREVLLDGVVVGLTAREFDLLHHLVSSPRQVFSRAQLLDSVWSSSPEWQTENTVTEHVHRLRQKVGGERIVTVRGVGYRFEPAVGQVTGGVVGV
jgi:two-component system phosphate regulon response regulator PhoB